MTHFCQEEHTIKHFLDAYTTVISFGNFKGHSVYMYFLKFDQSQTNLDKACRKLIKRTVCQKTCLMSFKSLELQVQDSEINTVLNSQLSIGNSHHQQLPLCLANVSPLTAGCIVVVQR